MRVFHIAGTSGRPRKVDGERFYEITVETDDGESLSFLVAYADKDKAEEVIVLGSEHRRRNEVRDESGSGPVCSESLACSDSLSIGSD